MIMTIKRVTLDYGHGGEKPGASYAGVLEKTVNLQLGNKIYSALHNLNISDSSNVPNATSLNHPINVTLTRDSDQHIPLSIRYQLINKYHTHYPIDLVVSIHFNAAPTVPQAHGFEVYHLAGSIEGTRAAKTIIEKVVEDNFYIRGRGHKTTAELGRKLAIIHKTVPPAILIETGFLSNEADRNNAIDPVWQDEMANTIAAGILNYLREAEL